MKCFKCGTDKEPIIKHHTNYSPENIVNCCLSCHRKIHVRLRKENKCSLHPDVINKLSSNSSSKRYNKKNIRCISFSEEITAYNIPLTAITEALFEEYVFYNEATGSVSYSSLFRLNNGENMKSGELALTKAEWVKLQSVIYNFEDELLIKLAITTGIRREDIVSIKISNISLPDATLTFHESKKNRDRTIPLTPEIVQLITKYLKTIPKQQEYLFDFTGRTAWNKLNRLCLSAGIPPRPFHALRATCVKFCQAAKWTPSEVSKLTGDSLRVIEEHYSTPSDSEMKEAVTIKSILTPTSQTSRKD